MQAPPGIDFAAAIDDFRKDQDSQKQLRHIGIIVSKTGHDRGQKEMFLYSPTVKRDNGLLVCSHDFYRFEVGEWILFNALVTASNPAEVYLGGKKWPDPYKTKIQFDHPTVKVKACLYPDLFSSIVCRQQTFRCWSPELGDVFIDNKYTKSVDPLVKSFVQNRTKLFTVVAAYHFNASIFHDGFHAGPDGGETKVYWRIDRIIEEADHPHDAQDWVLAPWRRHVYKYLDHRASLGDCSNCVPPWYTRSMRVLTHDMILTWEFEVQKFFGTKCQDDHPVPVLMDEETKEPVKNEFGQPWHPSDIFAHLKLEKKAEEDKTNIDPPETRVTATINSWKHVMSYDGKMLPPGALLPCVSNIRKKTVPDDRVELVQDSAGLFMSSAAALSYVEIKESGTKKLWTTGGWKKPGEAWDGEAAKNRWDKNLHRADEVPLRGDLSPGTISALPKFSKSKNLLSTGPPKKVATVPVPSSPVSIPSPVPVPVNANLSVPSTPPQVKEIPPRIPTGDTPPKFSFASAAKTAKDSDEFSDESESGIDPKKLNDEGRSLYEKYKKLVKYVREMSILANEPPAVQGFTAKEYIDAQRKHINIIEKTIQWKLKKEKEGTEEIISCYSKIALMKKRVESGKVAKSEIVEVHLSKEDDAVLKNLLKGHVDIQSKRMDEMKKRLMEMNKTESKC